MPSSSSNSSLSCQLPFFDSFDTAIVPGQQYAMYVWLRFDHVNRTGVGKRSNLFTVSFATSQPAEADSAGTSSGTLGAALIGVVVVVVLVVVAATVTAWLWYRTRYVGHRAASRHSSLLAPAKEGDSSWSQLDHSGDVQLHSLTHSS